VASHPLVHSSLISSWHLSTRIEMKSTCGIVTLIGVTSIGSSPS
jgi:hypothetical protein